LETTIKSQEVIHQNCLFLKKTLFIDKFWGLQREKGNQLQKKSKQKKAKISVKTLNNGNATKKRDTKT
jgi:hypothetical protein